MKNTVETPCTCGARLLFPFNLLALSFGVIICTLMLDTYRQSQNLKLQLVQTDQQGRQVVAMRQHYYNLYTDLVNLASNDVESAAIIRKYGIQINQPEGLLGGAGR